MTESSLEHILIDRRDRLILLTINRPPVNALNTAVGKELCAAFERIDADMSVGCVILTGSGDRAFAAGADIRELQNLTGADFDGMVQLWRGLFHRMETFRVPIIAAVNGLALGGGCELAMACDFRIAAENARFGQPEINLGLIPGWGGTQRLPRLIGQGRALELLMTGEPVDTAEAYRIGLVNHVTTGGALMEKAQSVGQALAGKAPVALRLIKECVHAGMNRPLDEALSFENGQFGSVWTTEDRAEGIAAFLEKRAPTFHGR